MAIGDDFIIDTLRKCITHSAGTTIYTVNQLYSYLHEYFNNQLLLSSTFPMTAQTPSEYTLVNGWFINGESYRYLRGGAIKTIGHDADLYSDGIVIVKFDAYTPCDPSDIGLTVSNGVSSGMLLDFDNTLKKWWVRKVSGTNWLGATTIANGMGSGIASSVATGESTHINVFTLGELEPTSINNIYIEQVNPELVDNKAFQFWGQGHIDVLIKVREANMLIDGGRLNTYCRMYGNTYTHYKATLTSGRNPIPLSSMIDTNNTTDPTTVGEWNDVTVTFGTFTRDVGDGLATYDVEIDCGIRMNLNQVYERLKYITSGDSVVVINNKGGSVYRSANELYTENIQSPFGSYAGGKFTGARGVWIKNVPTIDINNYQVVDNSGLAHRPRYTAIGAIKFDTSLMQLNSNGVYRLFYKQLGSPIGSLAFGTNSAVQVLKDDGITQVAGDILSSVVYYDYDYDGNTQSVWLSDHQYYVGDEFRYGINWYRAHTDYMSGETFGSLDVNNCEPLVGPTVVLVATSNTAQYTAVEGSIARSVENVIVVDAIPELNYTQ